MTDPKITELMEDAYRSYRFSECEDDTDLASEGAEPWTDAREGRDTEGGY